MELFDRAAQVAPALNQSRGRKNAAGDAGEATGARVLLPSRYQTAETSAPALGTNL